MSVKAAILGAGNMGKGHAQRLMKLGAEVTCVCDKSPEARKRFLEETKISGIEEYEEFDEMLEKGDFDALFICLPPFAQDAQFEKAAARGKHIFIEKPIALNTETGKRMVKAAKDAGIVTRVGFHMRQGKAVQKVREMIQSGEAGRPVLFHGHYSCNSLHTPWWINVDLCGGQIYEQAIHVYDMCRFLLGEPKSTSGIMGNICHNHMAAYTVEDVSASITEFKNGAAAAITANNCEIPNLWIGSFKVVYENITADFKDFNHAVITYTNGKEIRTEVLEDEGDAYADEVAEFIRCIEAGTQTTCDITEGYKSLCFVESVVASAERDGVKTAIHK